jgi:hypothetical protein
LVAVAVDEERRCSGHAREIGRLDVLGDPPGGLAHPQRHLERFDVEADRLCVGEDPAELKVVLVGHLCRRFHDPLAGAQSLRGEPRDLSQLNSLGSFWSC